VRDSLFIGKVVHLLKHGGAQHGMEFFRWRSFAGVVEWCEFIDGEIGENLFPEKFCP
jgi:hypothetical protein